MTTSGTVAQTVIDTSKIVEHALRRCRVKPALQTPEVIATATESLYMLLLTLANRGLNLWCVDSVYVGCVYGQAVYPAPAGTIDILNLVYSQPTRATGTDTSAATSLTTELSGATRILRAGLQFSAVSASDTLTLASSPDGVTWTTCYTSTRTDWEVGEWYWIPLDPSVTDTFFRASMGTAVIFTEFYLASQIYDLPVQKWSRDTWSVMNNKASLGAPSTSYYYEKLITPQVTLWPVPNVSYNHLTMFIHRQVQDVGTLIQTLEIPERWKEGIIWQLASRLCFELDMVPPEMIQNIIMMADKNLIEVEDGEADGAPIMMAPAIGRYTA